MAKTPQPSMSPTTPSVDPGYSPGRLRRFGLMLGVVLVALAYLLPGLTGHDPWKQDEAYSFGIIYNMVTTGDLVVPTLVADPFLEQPPAYYISATGMVHLLGDVLPMHDAARVTTGIYLVLTFLFAGLWARRTWGPGLGGAAVLGLIGSLGLMLHGHWMTTDVALTAGMAMACYGLLRAREAAGWGGLWLGTGAGLAFLSKGLLGAGIPGVAALLLLLFGDWRNRAYLRALALALVWAAPWLLVWPAELYLRSPDLFRLWLVDNDLGRYLGSSHLGPLTDWGFWLRTLPWVTFPLLPLALWTLVRHPRRALGNPGVRVALVVSLVGWGALLSSGTGREVYALPWLAPLAVIAAGGLRDLPGWLVALCYWICVLLFAALAVTLWAVWGYGQVAGHPPEVALIARYLPLEFVPTLHLDAALLALALTLGWVLGLKWLSPPGTAALAAWPLGLTLGWGLVMLLHLPWLDAAKSYRGVFTELAAQLPAGYGCVAAPADEKDPAKLTEWTSMRLRESERGLLHTVAGIKAVEAATPAQIACDWVLVEVSRGRPTGAVDPGPNWLPVWEGRRPADRRDTFMLFHRAWVVEPETPVGPAESLPGQAAELQTQQEVRPGGEVQPEPKPLLEPETQPEPETQSEPVGQAEPAAQSAADREAQPEAQQAPQDDPDPEIERPQPGTAQEVVPHA